MMIARHGGESHVLRPDLTYITSFLQPASGFDPTADVMATTNAFTLAPMQFQQGAPLQGFGLGARRPIRFLGPSSVRLMGPMATLGAKLKLWWGQLKMRFQNPALAAAVAAPPAAPAAVQGFTPYGPIGWAGANVMPSVDQRSLALMQMGMQNVPFSAVDPSLLARRYGG